MLPNLLDKINVVLSAYQLYIVRFDTLNSDINGIVFAARNINDNMVFCNIAVSVNQYGYKLTYVSATTVTIYTGDFKYTENAAPYLDHSNFDAIFRTFRKPLDTLR